MAAKVCVAGVLLVLACVGVGLIVQAPAPAQREPIVVKALPDLLVKKVTIAQTVPGKCGFTVIVQNVGTDWAQSTNLGLYRYGLGVLISVETPSMPAGGERTVQFSTQLSGAGNRAYLVFVADAPRYADPLGVLTEGTGKGNNSFVVAYTMVAGNSDPRTFTNQAAM